MITHYIIMSSSYSEGKRIALSNIVKEKDYMELKQIVQDITEECGKDVSLSTHFVQTDSESWKSVVEKDHFFKGVEVIKSKEKFIELIKKDRILKGIDVAKYILSKIKCTHLKLEKLVYLCYAEYLCQYGMELYKDKIYAYKYGPVIESVYEKYKEYGCRKIDDIDIDTTDIFEMPSRSRIIFAENGLSKIKSIDTTLEKYGTLSAGDLVDLTHKIDTPWFLSGEGKLNNKIIENDVIKKFHSNECI